MFRFSGTVSSKGRLLERVTAPNPKNIHFFVENFAVYRIHRNSGHSLVYSIVLLFSWPAGVKPGGIKTVEKRR